MKMKCLCGHEEFLLDYNAVRKIDSSGKVLSTQIADPCGEAVTCAKCFQTRIVDAISGKMVNQSPKLVRQVFLMAESSQSSPPAITDEPAGLQRTDVMLGYILAADWHESQKDREDAIGILADQASGRVHEAVQVVLNGQTDFKTQTNAGVFIRVTLSVHPETDDAYFAKPETKKICYTVMLD